MAFRFRILIAALLVLVGIGCRKPLAPSSDSNAAPETWITAAPQDTITSRNDQGQTTGPVSVGVIAFRFHLYWAGSDHDGEVRGFYWAVTETVRTPGIETDPPVPAPKPSDYRYTSKTDSVFIFNVAEQTRTRRHAFYLAAVDNEGKVDPTPARFVFDALDRFPPFAAFVHSYADGFYRDPRTPNAPAEFRRFFLSDTVPLTGQERAPTDTVPSASRLLFRWRGQETITGNPAVSFKYKLYETGYVTAAPGVDSAVYGPERSGEGRQTFEVRAVDVAGGSRTDHPTTRFFVVNFTPDSWFAGPDPSVTGFYSTNWSPGFNDGQKFRDIANWSATPVFPGSLLGPDSLLVMPKDRIQRKTFFEVYRNRVYMRAENDTVNLNSWVIFFGGGFDSDSPYKVRVDGFKFNPITIGSLDDTTTSPVVKKAGPNGSPIGLRLSLPVLLYPRGPLASTPLSPIFPLDEAINVPEAHIAGYIGMRQSGRGFAVLRAVDGDGRIDDRIPSPWGLVDSLERNILQTERIPLRSRVLTFYINRAPYLQTWFAGFLPPGPWNRPPGNPAPPYATRDITLNWSLHQQDQDPFDSSYPTGGPPQNTTPVPRFRYTLSVRGQTAAGNDTVYRPTLPTLYRADVAPPSISIPSFLQGPDVTLECELCDYPTAEFISGQGRCRYYSFPIKVPVVNPTAAAPLRARPNVKTGPGNPRNTDGGLN